MGFKVFFEQWTQVQKQQLHELIEICKSPTEADEETLRSMLQSVVNHYENYYVEKGRAARHNVFAMFHPDWTSSFEDGFLWVGGWRPTSAFQLLYSKSSMQFMARLSDLLQGIHTGDLGDLSAEQWCDVEIFQRHILTEEEDITEKLEIIQMTLPDKETVTLSEELTEWLFRREQIRDDDGGNFERRTESMLVNKEEVLLRVLRKADNLRLRTLKGLVEIFSLKQALHFFLCAAAFHLRIHEWGVMLDEKKLMGK